MRLLGLTGGIGMGKSTAAERLASLGCAVVDTDLIARDLVRPGTSALQAIGEAFGTNYIDAGGELKRHELAGLVFWNPAARLELERIMHPRIRAAWLETVARWRAEGIALGVVVIPLLFETGAQTEFDGTITVACAASTQKARLSERKWSGEEIERRIAAQYSSEEKIKRADWVVWSEGALATHQKQLERILAPAA